MSRKPYAFKPSLDLLREMKDLSPKEKLDWLGGESVCRRFCACRKTRKMEKGHFRSEGFRGRSRYLNIGEAGWEWNACLKADNVVGKQHIRKMGCVPHRIVLLARKYQ